MALGLFNKTLLWYVIMKYVTIMNEFHVTAAVTIDMSLNFPAERLRIPAILLE
jgi:hypothetical protein